MAAGGGRFGRRGFLKGATAVTLGSIAARGVYEVLDEAGGGPARAWVAAAVRRLQEQYLVDQIEVILDNGVTVAIPPLHNDVFTAKLNSNLTWSAGALRNAQRRVESALAAVEKPYASTAAGLTMVIGWGLPFFRTFVPSLMGTYLPADLALTGSGPKQYAVLDAIPFPSDPPGVVLEDNHVMFKFRSDSSAIVSGAERALFEDQNSGAYIGDLFELTSKRIGFLGRGFGTRSIAKTLAQAAGVPGADSIPDNAQLTMGFTSTQTQALGPDNIVSFETLPGITDQWPSGYFAAGCAMHLSHLFGYWRLVRQLRLRRAGQADVLAPRRGADRSIHGHDPQRPRRGLDHGPGPAGRGRRSAGAQRAVAAGRAAWRQRHRQLRPASAQGELGAAAGGLQHAGQPVLLVPPDRVCHRQRSGHALCGLPASQPPVPPGPQGDGRRDAGWDELSGGPLLHLGREQRHQREDPGATPSPLLPPVELLI
jgi:hypothetical protein